MSVTPEVTSPVVSKEMKENKIKRFRNCRGFTLTEALVTTSIFTIISAGMATFMVDTSEGLFWAMKKSLISKDVRHFTQRITMETLGANTAYVYPSYLLKDRDKAEDRKQSGESGDCLVLIQYDPYPGVHDDKHYTKVIVYYREPDANGKSPVYRIEKSFDPPSEIKTDSGFDHFENFLNENLVAHNPNNEIVIELSRGLADGSLFRNLGNNSYIVNGEILHGNEVKEITNTYNLTISPRG